MCAKALREVTRVNSAFSRDSTLDDLCVYMCVFPGRENGVCLGGGEVDRVSK